MAEREILQDAISIRGIDDCAFAQSASALWLLACQQVAFTSVGAKNFSARGYFEPFCHSFACLNTFWAAHNFVSILFRKRARNIGAVVAGIKRYFPFSTRLMKFNFPFFLQKLTVTLWRWFAY
jgi:hypothetical protein